MKIPKRMRSYCPSCKTHQEIVVERVKKGQASSMTHIARQKRRQEGIGNSGKFSKVPGGDKPTKRIWLRYRCTVCKKAYQPPAFRAKKFEFKE